MEDDPLELCRRAYELYGRADFDSMLKLFAQDVEVYVAPPNIESGTYRGRDAYRRLIERWGASWSEMQIEPVSMKAVGSWVLAVVEYSGRTRGGDLEIKQRSWELSRWEDGRVHRYEVYFDAEQGPRSFAEREAELAGDSATAAEARRT
jgi:ketosteroid isomerase-like protein